MKLFYLVFVLVFSSLILVNTIPAYAETVSLSPSIDGYIEEVDSNNICDGGGILNYLENQYLVAGVPRFGSPKDCYRMYLEWDVSAIPDGAVVSDVEFSIDEDPVASKAGDNQCRIYSLSNQPSVTSASSLWDDLADGTQYNSIICDGTGGTLNVSLGSAGITDLTSNLNNGWFGMSVIGGTEIQVSNIHKYSNFQNPILTITYSANSDTTPPIITLIGNNPQEIELGNGYTELGATTDDGSAVTIDSSGFADAVGSYSITYNSVDSSGNNAVTVTRTVNVVDTTPPIITLTGNNPQEIELGSGYTELGATTDDGSAVTIDSSGFADAVGSYSITYNSVDSSGNNAVTKTRTVNVSPTYLIKNDLFYHHTRSTYNSTADKIIFTANKQQDAFSLFCNHFTSSTDEWNNQTSITSYDAEFLTKHTSYIRCYDESENIILLQTVYKPYGITSGFDMINESFGNDGLFGVPFPFLIVLIVASIWTGRNAQVGVIVTGATIGIMGLLGLFELSAEVWAMIVLLVAVGMFLGKKVF